MPLYFAIVYRQCICSLIYSWVELATMLVQLTTLWSVASSELGVYVCVKYRFGAAERNKVAISLFLRSRHRTVAPLLPNGSAGRMQLHAGPDVDPQARSLTLMIMRIFAEIYT